MWTYSQSSGDLVNPAGSKVGIGYSGNGPDMNNLASQDKPMHGPIPQGDWTIGTFYDDPGKGPIVARLTPASGTDTYGRSGFMVHGDNSAVDHTASEGCIVLPRVLREMLMASNDRALTVTS